jgi:hypothetical protein
MDSFNSLSNPSPPSSLLPPPRAPSTCLPSSSLSWNLLVTFCTLTLPLVISHMPLYLYLYLRVIVAVLIFRLVSCRCVTYTPYTTYIMQFISSHHITCSAQTRTYIVSYHTIPTLHHTIPYHTIPIPIAAEQAVPANRLQLLLLLLLLQQQLQQLPQCLRLLMPNPSVRTVPWNAFAAAVPPSACAD